MVTLKRPELRRLIEDCRAGKIGMLITKDAERLSRDYGQLAELLHIFQRTGVRIEFAAPATPDSYAFLKSVLAAATPNTKRTQLLRGVWE